MEQTDTIGKTDTLITTKCIVIFRAKYQWFDMRFKIRHEFNINDIILQDKTSFLKSFLISILNNLIGQLIIVKYTHLFLYSRI